MKELSSIENLEKWLHELNLAGEGPILLNKVLKRWFFYQKIDFLGSNQIILILSLY